MDFAGRSVLIVGKLDGLHRREVLEALKRQGGRLARGVGRRTSWLVVGHNAAGLVANGVLQARIAAADQAGIPCVSENAFLGGLRPSAASPSGIAPDPAPPAGGPADAPAGGAFSAAHISRTTGLPAEILRILALLDLIALDGDRGDFQALAAARQAARLLKAGTPVAEMIQAVRQTDKALAPRSAYPLASLRFDLDERRKPALRLGRHLANTNGQLRLGLPEAHHPAVGNLMAEAERAETAGDKPTAEALYRRCVDLDRNDATAAFNLAVVLCEQNRSREATLFFQVALARDPTCVAAWYNLAHLAESDGDSDLARDRLQRALMGDPGFADAAFNLARLHFAAGAYGSAITRWEDYLALDPDSKWARKARHGIALCRAHLRSR